MPEKLVTYFIRAPQDSTNKSPGASSSYVQLFESLFEQLHEALTNTWCSLEIYATSQNLLFGFTAPQTTAPAIAALLYSALPNADIVLGQDPAQLLKNSALKASGEIRFLRPSLIPLPDQLGGDASSLTNILNCLENLLPKERVLLQILIAPIKDSFMHQLSLRYQIKKARRHIFFQPRLWIKAKIKRELTVEISNKAHRKLFKVSMRCSVGTDSESRSPLMIYQSLSKAFTSYQTEDYNAFTFRELPSQHLLDQATKRQFNKILLLSSRECAFLYHIPPEAVAPSIHRVISHREPAPSSVTTTKEKQDICWFGETNFRSQKIPFGITRHDRRRHLYVLGKSGVGKSKLLELLIKSDIQGGHGIAILDPHGDLVDEVLRLVPEERVKDVILFDPADTQYPLAFNPLEHVADQLKLRVAISFLDIFKKLFGNNWSPRLEHVLRYTTLALLDSPGSTVLSILKMLSDKKYRQSIVRNIKDDVVKNFWVNEFAGWSEKFDSEAITPLVNKVGQFVSTNMIRNIVGQPENLLNFREIMDNKKILLVKISKGILGEENSSLLGAMIITKLYQAAMSRADILEKDRVDFYLYVDEFQNFATDTFDEILSEARKYRLNLTLANQFLGQLNQKTKTTVFGNVGSLISFRVGGADARELSHEFTPRFQERDLINLGVREFVTKLSVHGETVEAFSAKTLLAKSPEITFIPECIEHSRTNYTHPVEKVEKILSNWNENEKPMNNQANKPVKITASIAPNIDASDLPLVKPEESPITDDDSEFSEPLL